ncbi:P-loop containing nucleoside triphosphate hydrolase protein [Annulohypoxylon moriforme]|nr:P-loop containing nucleoside triphosphate hydrolase protein [Annulohypoxylon moriforme]
MAGIDVSPQRAQLLTEKKLLDELPPDLLEIIRGQTPGDFLDAIASAALIPQFTGLIFVHFENIFADICARWLLKSRNSGQEDQIIASFARILPFAPHLSVFLEQYISETSLTHGPTTRPQMNSLNSIEIRQPYEAEISLGLLALWRLLNFDKRTFGQLVLPSKIQALFNHDHVLVRYLAIRVFCCQLNASDYKLEELIRKNVREGESLIGDFDGVRIDYTFLSLLERQRADDLDKSRLKLQAGFNKFTGESFPIQKPTKLVAQYNTTILPRPNGEPSLPSSLVYTQTTLSNLENLAQNLQKSGPILLHGLPGSGKTSVVHELARELDMESSLVTLHLNEQTDAKMLIGLYSTGSKPGSFSWRPGVLTTAVREGRWVLIEDLDRAPNEVMSTLLPLVEHGKLLIPSRGETVEAPSSFRLFATVRTTRGLNGHENLPSMLGQRFWHMSSVKIPPPSELEQIIVGSYPLLHKYTPTIMSVYKRLCNASNLSSVGGTGRSTVERSITPRDVLKWCRRLQESLVASGCKTGDEPISETTRDWMFMDAADCFCGNLPKPEARAALVSCIAEEMHLSKQLMEHYLKAHVPQIDESPSNVKIGRVMLTRRKHANRIVKSKKPFASTSHSRRLLEQISMAVKLREPVLLVGETGIGKTTVIQQLAESLGHKLVAVNLSQQSEVGDLLGGFKPINARSLAVPLKEEFEDLFASTGISASKNQKYMEQIGKCTAKGQWTRVSKLWREAPKMFNKIVGDLQTQAEARSNDDPDGGPVAKRRKVVSRLQSLLDLKPRWEAFSKSLDQFDVQISGGSGSFAFAFVEGNIVKAARNGDWVLLDEINLASPDTLESIADLLSSGPNDEPSILLSETGDIERVKAHPDFRIFGAMNPATDIGKRDLPLGLRSRFTEFYVSSPDKDLKDLLTIIKAYLSGKSAKDEQAADDIARLYLNTKTRADEKRLVDGANEVPHFSLRTLTRVLSYVNDVSPFYGLRRALYEGFSMGFLTLLDRASEETLVPLIHHHLLDKHGGARSLLSQPPRHPNDGKQYVKFVNKNKDRQYWLLQGDETPIERSDYIITPYIERNLLNLVRATSTRRFPILIQGPTSAGKTSMIEYLANFSGNKFVRINNHEHTDLQEYLGTYVSDADGKLRFQEGLLVQALREGHWIVLDELNLAPTDVLEALNRLLDDNRELLIPETQEVVRPHENFMLFATQNPPGLYGGRKVLSRAFRNRFLELHFDDIPEDELEIILQKRSLYTAPSDCKRIVNVYKELSRLRQTSRLFENKDSFATLRDLFRWALRGAETREEIAANGFMLLAERVRNEEERLAVKKVIETVFKVKIDQNQLYDIQNSPYLRTQPPNNSQDVVWTHAMRRLYVLVASALRHNEPVLLVGETGCGKTTVCQLLAESLGKELHIVNAHQNTETGDLIGSQRPIRNRGAIADVLAQDLANVLQQLGQNVENNLELLLEKYHALDESTRSTVPADLQHRISDNEIKSKALFEWADGSLVHAMKDGQFFLLDEISLADDSVLERLNSVLEPQRSLLLAEKGIDDSFVKASDGFQFLATMNPGGDFGKKELSPALRNRFTEIWVPALSENEDVLQIVSSKLKPGLESCSKVIVEFSYWFGQNFRSTASTAFSIRDILVWVKFVNENTGQDVASSVIHGAATVFIDTLGANPSALIAIDPKSMDTQRQKCLDKLSELLQCDATIVYRAPLELIVKDNELQIGGFSIERITNENFETGFALHAPTTKLNAMRIIRALQVQKPILLEGSPGVGKTTLVSALARACGRPLTRINLSDQTDLMDLFGTDVPVEGAEAGHFAWRDAPFLRAMQNGEWVLLDEMNLASQSVLEGLNACLDHRGEVYVSELDQVFKRHPDFRLFAAQNPHHQGGGRKGLPSSFVNRFIVVYADVFSEEDLLLIAQHNFPTIPAGTVRRMINFISNIETRILVERAFGSQGSPWEFNLRDTLRWLHLLTSPDPLLGTGKVNDFLNIAIRQRFRTERDRLEVDKLFTEAFEVPPKGHQLYHNMCSSSFQVGLALMRRNELVQPSQFPSIDIVPRLMEIESILICIKQNIPCILVGPSGSGKSMLLQHIAASSGKPLITFPMNADIDAMDLVGGFEQSDPMRDINAALGELKEALQLSTVGSLVEGVPGSVVDLLNYLTSMTDQVNERQGLLNHIEILQSQISAGTELAVMLSNVRTLLQQPSGISNPRFEWLDGIIVQALQKGHWLVLDNANLCSASVLDRLNSLLEPDGHLIINEHCGPNGEPRVIKPHLDFRVFLTVDPRYGELSRAMRNRAIEIYVEPYNSTPAAWRSRVAEVESSLKRYELLFSASSIDTDNGTTLQSIAVDSISLNDLPLLDRFRESFRAIQNTDSSFLQSPIIADVQNALRHLYIPLSTVAPGLETIQVSILVSTL